MNCCQQIQNRPSRNHHHAWTIFAELPNLVWHEDEPIGFIASVPLYFRFKISSKYVKVVWREGSDEIMAGYGRYAKSLAVTGLRRKIRKFNAEIFAFGNQSRANVVGGKLTRTFSPANPTSKIYFLITLPFSAKRCRKISFQPKQNHESPRKILIFIKTNGSQNGCERDFG